MLGDTCTNCHNDSTTCTCEKEAAPCLPCNETGECGDWMDAKCVFWKGDDIPGTPIKKDMRLTEIILWLVSENQSLKARLVAANIP